VRRRDLKTMIRHPTHEVAAAAARGPASRALPNGQKLLPSRNGRRSARGIVHAGLAGHSCLKQVDGLGSEAISPGGA
jgi:hypothetical protein